MLLLAFAGVLVSCGREPMAGEPCAPGSPPFVVDEYSAAPKVWFCAAPGCESDEPPRWSLGSGLGFFVYCGCDGINRHSDADYGGPPNYPWRWYGSCEQPCEGVYFDPVLGYWVSPWGFVGLPAAAQCTDCTRALLSTEGECVDEDGLLMPEECCRCDFAMLDAGGTCMHRDYGFEMPAFCCG